MKCHLPNGLNHTYIGSMKATVTIDKAGRVVLPKTLRDELHLASGDTLDLTVEGERVTLCPRRTVPPLQKERGVWVFRIGEPLIAAETRETLRSIREQRAHRATPVSSGEGLSRYFRSQNPLHLEHQGLPAAAPSHRRARSAARSMIGGCPRPNPAPHLAFSLDRMGLSD